MACTQFVDEWALEVTALITRFLMTSVSPGGATQRNAGGQEDLTKTAKNRTCHCLL
jgi:hypothetical protein